MARNKDFFVNSAPKRDKSFFVKEDTKKTDDLWVESTAPNVLQKQNINATIKPVNISSFVNEVKTPKPKQNINTNVKPIDIKDYAIPRSELNRIGEEIKAEKERWDNLPVQDKIAEPFRNIGANFTHGDLSIKENLAWNEYRSKQDEATLKKAQEATKAREDFEATNDRIGKGNALTKDFAQYLPQLGGQLKSGLGGAAAGAGAGALGGAGVALAAGQLGPQVALPEEIATVPAGAITGGIWGGRGGYVAGTAKYGYDMMAGNAYKNLLDLGVPNDIALEISNDEAVISSLIEGGGAIVDLISLGIGKLASKGGTTAAKQVAKNRLIAAAKAYGLNVVSEGLEEGLQEVVSIGAEKAATEKAGIERQATLEDDINRVKEATKGGLTIAAIGGLGEAGMNYTTNTIRNKNAENQKAQSQINQDLQSSKNVFNEDFSELQNTSDVRNVLQNLPQTQNLQQANVVSPQNTTQNRNLSIQRENVTGLPKLSTQNQAQNPNVEQTNVTLPNKAEMAQNANMEQITQVPNLPTQKAQETLQSAKIAGMTDMDIQKAKELNDMLRSGTRLNFYDEKTIPQNVQADKAKIANGFYKDGTLWINKNSKNKVEQILGHELTHHLETTDSYTDLSNTILDSEVFYDFIAEKGYANVAEYKTKLKEMGYADAQLDNELVARFVEEKMFTDQKSIDRLARQNTKLVEKIKNWISDLVVSFKGTAQEKELRRIENMYRKALEQSRNSTNAQNLAYSIKEDANGKFVKVDTDQDIFEGINEKDYNKIAKMYMQDYLKGTTKLTSNDEAIIDTRGIRKYTNPQQRTAYFDEKMFLTPELKNVLEIAEKVEVSEANKDNSKYDNWEYYKFNFEIGDRTFEGLINIGIDKNGYKHFYEINKIHPIGISSVSTNSTNRMYSNNSINQNDSSVNTEYAQENKKDTAGKEPAFSMPETDNQGRTLSKEQQEFFKDSKVRDENGKLLEVYHGTPSGGFTIFDANKLSRDTRTTQYGKGFYFTDKQNLAKAYSEGENSQLYSVYLDIKNPFTISWLDDKSHNLDRDGLKNILLEGNNKEFYDKWIADSQSNIEKLGNLTKDNILKMSKEEKVELFLKGEYDRFNDQHVLRELVRAFNTNSELIDSMQRNLGYDGIIVEDKLRGNQYIAFNSNQIKNIDNTNPTSNPDIRYSMNPVEVAKNPPKSQESSLLNEIAPIDDKKLESVEEKETTASILTKSPKRPAKDLLKQSVDVVMRKLVDAGNTINTVGKLTGDKHLYEYFNNTKQARQSAEYMIGEAQTDIKGNRVGNSLIRIFEEVRSKGDAYTNEFFEYLLHVHNIDRMAQNKPVFGASVTAEDSRKIANQLLEKHPEFEKQANKVYAYNRNLMQWRVDSGLISKEQADLMNEMYPHYVPTFRDVSGTSGSRAMQGTVQIANTVRKATGSNKDIMPIDASMARQTMQTVQAAKRNLLGNRLLNDALNNKDKVGEYIQAVEKTTEQNDLETELDTPKDTNLDSNNNVFKIFRNGETYVMQVNNGIYEGLKSISSEIDNTDTKLLLKPVKAANNMFKKLITGYSPMFSLKNFSRDIQDSGLYSKELRKFIKKYPNTYKEMMGNGKMWQLYKSLGGTGSSFFDYETGIEKTLDSRNKVSTKIKEATLGKVEELNMMIEQAPRFAEFMATIEKAGNQNYDTLMEAMLNAADITVNFGRSGTWGKALNSTAVPFFNPSIQGFDKYVRTVLESKDGKKFAKLIVRVSLLGILPSVLNELLYWDDDEYENLSDRDKDTNFLIKTGDNKWLKIPKGRVLSIFGNTAARGLRTLKGEKWDAGEYLKNQASQTAPISIFDSNLYSPIQAVQNNKTWYGSDIVPQRLQDYAPKDQYDENTDAFSKWLGGKINYSPKKINYLIDAYTGIIGDVVLPLTTPKAETNPFTKAFVLDGVTSNEISNDFYNMLDKYNPKQNPKKSAKEVSRYLNKQSSQVSDIYKQIREVENSDISDDEKRKQVRELRELANTIELTAMATVPEYEKAVDKYRGTFTDEDVDSDYAYLFANRDIFGAEYAVKTFSKSLYNNHKDENMNTFFRNYFTREYFQKKLEPKETTKTTKNTLPTLSQQRAKLPTLKK